MPFLSPVKFAAYSIRNFFFLNHSQIILEMETGSMYNHFIISQLLDDNSWEAELPNYSVFRFCNRNVNCLVI